MIYKNIKRRKQIYLFDYEKEPYCIMLGGGKETDRLTGSSSSLQAGML